MSWHTLRKRLGEFFSRQRQQWPPSRPPGEPCAAAATGVSEPSEKVRGMLHSAAARGDLAWLRRWRGYWKWVGIDWRDQQRRTPLHLASANGHADVVKYLAKKNCQLNLADNFRRTPLMEAVRCQQEECVAVLLEHGADPNLADADGNTALHLAVLSANTAVAQLLLEHNASSDAQNQEGYTPLDLAVSKQHEEMLECLPKKAVDGYAAEQCERALAVTSSHVSDGDEDNLCLQEELETVEAELRELQEKYLQSEHVLHDLKIAFDDKNREETAAVLKLQDQLLAYLETNTAVKRLEGEAHCLEMKNARLEATVQQQSNKIEALVGHLLPSASASMPQLQQKLASAAEVQSTSKASLAVATSHGTDVEKDNLCLQEELARVRVELRELQEKYLQSEHCVHNLKTALNDKERERTAASQKLEDLLLASSDTMTIVKELEECMQRLVMEKTLLEGTVKQQNTRIDALQRELQASASAPVPQLQQKLASAAEVRSTSKATQAVTTSHWANLEKDNLYLHKELARVRVEVIELSQQLTMESKRSMQLEAKNWDLQEELSTLHDKCEKLEKSKCQLKEEVAKLQNHLKTNMVERSQMEQYKKEAEERASQYIRERLLEVNLFLQAQAASQDRLEQIRTSHHASLRNQLKDRIRDLECELDKIKNTQQETTFPKEYVLAEMEKYKELCLEEVKIRQRIEKKLERFGRF